MTKIAVVPGSFDPITMGHVDVIQRAANIFDEVHVLVVHNPNKVAMLPIAERTGLIQKSLDELPDPPQNVEIASWSVGLLVDYCTEVGANVIVKGIRSQIDVSYETPMAIMNRSLAGVETVFLLPDPANAHVSSTLVREVSEMGGDVAPYVPAPVARFLSKRKPA